MTKEKIIELITPFLEDDKFFIVDLKVTQTKTRTNITILLDSDTGIMIEDCASISRRLAHQIEEQDLIKDAFNLEVSSPGVDFPLTLVRQYAKNIGRTLKIELKDKTEKIGVLEALTDSGISLMEERKKKPKKDEVIEAIMIPFEEISVAKVQISFK